MTYIFSDEYTGPRYRYGLTYRPIAVGAVPAGWIIGSQRPHARFRYGTIDYPQQLPEGQAQSYELTLVEVEGA